MFFRLFRFMCYILSESLKEEAELQPDTPAKTDVPSKYYEREEKTITGKVTHIYDSYGLVDGYIYFDNDSVRTRVRPQLEDTVDVNAVRQARHTGWRAVSVRSITEEWDSIREVYQTSGMVTNVRRDGSGTVNQNYIFSANCCKEYEPWRGDKVLVTLVSNGLTEVVQTIHPFITEKYTGRVVHVGQWLCYIDGDIAFTRQCCINNYMPKKGDVVTGRMLECDQGQRWRHRALTVYSNSHNLDKPSAAAEHAQADGHTGHINSDYIFIEGDLKFKEVDVGSAETRTIFIRNGTKECIQLNSLTLDDTIGAQFMVAHPMILLEGQHAANTLRSAALCLLPGMTAYFTLTFQPRYVGEDGHNLLFHFSGLTLRRAISGTGVLGLPSDDSGDDRRDEAEKTHDAGFRSCRPIKHNISRTDLDGPMVPGVRPEFRAERMPKYLARYEVPKGLRECVSGNTWNLSQVVQELSHGNYVEKMSTLLFVEEIEAGEALRRFDMPDATFGRSGEYLTLVVPGLPDGQPHLMVSDQISAKVNSHMQDLNYQGYIHDIRGDTIYLKFSQSFHDSYDEEQCLVIFHVNRAVYRRMHNAVHVVHDKVWPGLFPNNVTIQQSRLQDADSLNVSDESWLMNKKLNKEQRLAVKRVLQAKCRPHPYIIFGPPGTGKTMTVVECIIQVFMKVRGSRILVCTPSNSAADLLTVQLWKSYQWPENSLVRLNSFCRQQESLPEEIRPICQDGMDLAMVVQHKVIVCTCSSAGMMHTLGLSTDHFTNVFIDEAGQASEPECLVPLALVASNPQTSIALSGDHKQLGPVIGSRLAKDSGLALSFLERLMAQPLYNRQNSKLFKDTGYYDPTMVTKLLRNYRSHPLILSLYSQLFYDNELIASAPAETYSLGDIEETRSRNKPIRYIGISGEEKTEGDNPSWFNPQEVVEIYTLVQKLRGDIAMEDIGIITPYRKQVEKIRMMSEYVEFGRNIKVGSVEEFQGQERKVIILSTVRSTTDDTLGNTGYHNLGFLTSCKRLNVAISRAQGLLIIVGNPLVLSQDKHWKKVIDFFYHSQCYFGVPYTP